MRRVITFAAAVAIVAACGGTTEPPVKGTPKPDPYITIRTLNHLDTTTAPGRARWRVYLLLSGPYPSQNGIANQGNYDLSTARTNQQLICMGAGADSIGQRLVAPFAIADTTTTVAHNDAAYDSVVTRWFNGNHANPPAGYMILTITPIDAWDSQQYAAGHGLTDYDPIKWAWDWSGNGSTSFTERAPSDTASCNKY